ncbi:MAG: glutamate formiminotransferase, partial [Caldilineaceae bacterium]|nr:glutamate formiminotransferase [Caldilineaceae bacterium]
MSDRKSGVLIEAAPNFSEGRRVDVVDAIARAIHAPGVRLLDRTSDPHHNRSVLT